MGKIDEYGRPIEIVSKTGETDRMRKK